jgi:menaquinone-dependent protoporphyrinogen IX oxidase
MKAELYHASKYGNGAKVADEIKRLMTTKGIDVNIHHIDEVSPKHMPQADLFIFGSPTHFGKAPGGVLRFLKKLDLPSGTRYAVFTTCSTAIPDKKTGKMPSEEELEKMRRTIPMMDEQLMAKGMNKVAETKVFVQPEHMKGPLEDGWQDIVMTFVEQILESS